MKQLRPGEVQGHACVGSRAQVIWLVCALTDSINSDGLTIKFLVTDHLILFDQVVILQVVVITIITSLLQVRNSRFTYVANADARI